MEILKQIIWVLVTKLKHLKCRLVNNGHELQRVQIPEKIFHECMFCGYQTPGWELHKGKLKPVVWTLKDQYRLDLKKRRRA